MRLNTWLGGVAVLAIGMASWRLHAAVGQVRVTQAAVGTIPVTIYRPADDAPHPVVLIANGFAGSRQLMQSFALTLARNDYVAVSFDFAGHGRNPTPLSGSITAADGATRVLVAELTQVAGFARGLGDGRLAVLGHSMASDIVVRFAEATPEVAATIAVSLYSPAVTATTPRNLLVIVGGWEGMLKREALRVVGLAAPSARALPGVTVGDPALGTGRRAAFSAHVEHVSVLFSADSMRETVNWLDQTFGRRRNSPPVLDDRGPWILLLLTGTVLLARPLAALLPRIAVPPAGAGLGWARLWMPLLLPMIATPLLLRFLPTHFLPVLVGDYLAAHFAVYGMLTLACLRALRRPGDSTLRAAPRQGVAVAASAVIGYGFLAIVWPINRYVTSFVAGPQRLPLIAALLIGTLLYFVSDEWLTRGNRAARGAHVASKFAFLASLAMAVALDSQRLFFLIIIVPVIAVFFLVYGLFSRWIYRQTGQPLIAGIANAVAFAWAIGVTFPLLAG